MNKFAPHQNLLLVIITIIFSCSCFRSAEAMMISQELGKAFRQVDAVIDAKVLRTERIEWSAQDQSGSCGYIVKVRINSSFSGALVGEIEIGSKYPLVPGSRYLLFIQDRPSGFAVSDFFQELEQQIQEPIDACKAKSPSLTSHWWFTSEIAGNYTKFAFFPGLLLVPDDLRQFTDSIDCKV